MRKSTLILWLYLLTFNSINAQSIDLLKQQIHKVLKNKKAHVGVAIEGVHPKDIVSINGDDHLPMQSVFKYHLALAVLHQVDLGKFDLNESISIDKKTIAKYNHLWSPLRKKYPNGAKVTLAEIIKYTVAWSDNIGCDLLFELVGGLKAVENYLHKIGIKDIAIVHNEINMQAQWDRQFENWTTAKAANKTLKLFYKNANNLLSKKSYNFLLDVLKGTQTGKKSIRGFLPKDTIVAHKTGHSGKNKEGLTGAVNDIGIVFLPNGSHFYLSVLVSNSTEPDTTNQKIIAEIGKLAWDYFKNK
ncbi:class A beta-lactamase, subclass A2 [Tenacibaculum sp. MAR_2009_124]|uniref:class A beta-lactamase, subclass A2 n=1 Tax=Tenacibaculum sp. MAR_2009_124 TaxID=1250059 RepID=UPI000B815FB3|nr:class A beta-lactamase, subclass A2 [Tenacibaculum sp. MAR_2009_124]